MNFNVQLFRDSFEALKPVAIPFVQHFFRTLFENHPETRSLFDPARMPGLEKAFVTSLVTIVENVNQPEKFQEHLFAMGRRHARYGVQQEHFGWVGESLLQTLRFYFAENWTFDLEQTWIGAFGAISGPMLKGLNEVRTEESLAAEIRTAEARPTETAIRIADAPAAQVPVEAPREAARPEPARPEAQKIPSPQDLGRNIAREILTRALQTHAATELQPMAERIALELVQNAFNEALKAQLTATAEELARRMLREALEKEADGKTGGETGPTLKIAA